MQWKSATCEQIEKAVAKADVKFKARWMLADGPLQLFEGVTAFTADMRLVFETSIEKGLKGGREAGEDKRAIE